MPPPRILETVLYADDLEAAVAFYTEVIGLEVRSRFGDAVAFHCGEGVLLVFDPDQSRAAGRAVPPHGAEGEGHVAFAIERADFDVWRRRLRTFDVAIEEETDWGRGRRSIYFRDPAGNLVELAPPDLWA